MKPNWHTMIGVTTAVLVSILVLQPGHNTVSAQGQTGSDQSQRTLNVSGTGQVSARPDTAIVTLGVQTEAEQASAALSENNQQMQAVIDALKQAGVAAEDIQTQVINLQPRYEQPPAPGPSALPGTPKLVGYVATNTVEATVRELDMLGKLLDAAVQAGSNQIQGIRFEVSNPATLLDQARAAAWQDAQHKAEQLADLAGGKLGVVLTINETSQTPRPVVMGAIQAAAPAAVPVEPGTQTIEINVQVTWSLVE
jgi:uncharacterized protein YggE